MDIEICKAKEEDFAYIREKVEKYLLDATDIDWPQFFVAKIQDKIVAFGRIIDHGDAFEIGTLGVDYYHRKKGIGKRLVSFLVQEAKRLDGKRPIYGVTHAPRFVSACGFVQIKDNYPDYLEHKRRDVCKLDPSKIVIMRWVGS